MNDSLSTLEAQTPQGIVRDLCLFVAHKKISCSPAALFGVLRPLFLERSFGGCLGCGRNHGGFREYGELNLQQVDDTSRLFLFLKEDLQITNKMSSILWKNFLYILLHINFTSLPSRLKKQTEKRQEAVQTASNYEIPQNCQYPSKNYRLNSLCLHCRCLSFNANIMFRVLVFRAERLYSTSRERRCS